ncbi:MAG: hypothetical protein ABW298_10765 [Candidatus Binatia bacterium]|jgi:hypothetical protein
MARRMWSIAIVGLALPLLGMGMLGGGGSGGLERNYQGTFVDRDGTKVEAKWINAGGELALSGELGRGDLRISFDNIRSITFSGDPLKGLVAKVSLHKGDPVDVKVRSSLAFSGQTSLGLYQIRARDLQAVEFAAE